MIRLILPLLLMAGVAGATDRIAASASTADVQTAVNAAADGDRVLIPNGSATWTSGISTTKQILIQAQNYTPTEGGAASRSVVITHSGSGDLFNLQSGNSFHVGVGGIQFARGTATTSFIDFNGSGSKPPLCFDCTFEDTNADEGASADLNSVSVTSLGAVFWNFRFDGSDNPFNGSDLGVNIAKTGVHMTSPRLWTTASTMGAADTNGLVNVYFEDGLFLNAGVLDADDHSRFVVRHSALNGTRQITHGFTSSFGGRHWEYYNCTYSVTTSPRNLAGAYFWCRAGTGIFTDNVVNDTSETSDYGSVDLLLIGDNTSPSSYPMNRQPGGGHNGSAYVVDPIYIWSNTGARAYTWGFQEDPGGWEGIVQTNRDIFVNNGAKPGYSKYTYPHPLRAVVEGGGDMTAPTLTSSTIGTSGASITLAFDEAVTRNSGTPTVSLSGGACTLTYSSGSGTSSHVYSLSRTVQAGETGTLSATPGANGWEDAAGNDVATISGASIMNNSTQTTSVRAPGRSRSLRNP